ncbi:Z-DNA-binding protein 1 isoform X5 [Camelus bactrianus]|uniref:Z-DNA-binding protein 1 isoform X5 n=1 Tax=Camelus bactrianus TaxID=9837 RepID=A0AC58P0N8_CAMBA
MSAQTSAPPSALDPSPGGASSPGWIVRGTQFSLCLCLCLPLPDLEERILEVLRDAGSPVKTAHLLKKCQVPKKKLNQVLHQMKKESKGGLTLVGPALWCLGDSGTREVVPTEPAERPQQDTVAVPRKPGAELSERQEEIYRFLEARGPHKALIIAQALGMKTAKEVNPDLYALRNKHLLHLDEKSHSWAVYRPGSTAPLYLPPRAPADPSTQGPLAGSLGPQDIRMEESVLRRVQMGHGNQMSLHSHPAESPAHSAHRTPPVSVPTAGPEASIEIQIPEPGAQTEGVMSQRVHIHACFLEDTTVGNNNRMTISPGAGGHGGVAGPEEGRRGPGEPGEGADPPSRAERLTTELPPDGGQAAPIHDETHISQLEAMTLKSRGPRTPEDGP